MRDSDSIKLRPIDAFVKYFQDVKPYHTKLLEVVERYKFAESIDVTMSDAMFAKISFANNPLCRSVGFGLVFDDCGFSNDNCCDLFQCIGGYGVIWDNSDLVGVHAVQDVFFSEDRISFDGNLTFDRRLQILRIDTDSLVLKGDVTREFIYNQLFLIAPFNVYAIRAFGSNLFTITGDISSELRDKKQFRVSGTRGLDGLYGVASVTYDSLSNLTVVTIAGNRTLSGTVGSGYLETESQPKNQGFYAIDNANLDADGNTLVVLKSGFIFPAPSIKNSGSVQLRTGLTAPRHIHLHDTVTDTEREYRIADTYYDLAANQTHVILAEQLWEGEVYDELRMYGYMTNPGLDADELCDTPKPTNVHVLLGEKLDISIINLFPYITSTATTNAVEGDIYTYGITSTDPRNLPTTLSIDSAPAWLTLTNGPDGTGTLTGKPPWISSRTYPIVLRVTNERSQYSDQYYTLSVVDISPDPVITSTPILNVVEGNQYTYNLTSTDPQDLPRTFALLSAPDWMGVSGDTDGTAIISGRPMWDSPRTFSVVVRVTNVEMFYGEQTYVLNIANEIPDVILASAGLPQTQICNDLTPLSPVIIGYGEVSEMDGHTYLWEQIDASDERVVIVNATSLDASYIGAKEHTIRFWLDKGTAKEQFKDINIYKTPVTGASPAGGGTFGGYNLSAGSRTAIGPNSPSFGSLYTSPVTELHYGMLLYGGVSPIGLYWDKPTDSSAIISYRVERYNQTTKTWVTVAAVDKDHQHYTGPGLNINDLARVVTVFRDLVSYGVAVPFTYESVSEPLHLLPLGASASPADILLVNTVASGNGGGAIEQPIQGTWSTNLPRLIAQSSEDGVGVDIPCAVGSGGVEYGALVTYSTNLPSLISRSSEDGVGVDTPTAVGSGGMNMDAVQTLWNINIPSSTTIGYLNIGE